MRAECPRCPGEIESGRGVWSCPMHGSVTPVWRPETPDYDSLADHLERAGTLPSWTPWPMPPGWSINDFGTVGTLGTASEGGSAAATFVTCGGMTETDGPATLTVVTEEPGTGLGARVAGVVHDDPGVHTQGHAVQTRARIGGAMVPLWLLPTTGDPGGRQDDEPWDRAVLVGEAQGRWVWLVVTPASAALGLADWGPVENLGDRGPELVALRFGTPSLDW